MAIYKVALFDTEDGGHLLGEAYFEAAKEARNEFLRVRNAIKSEYVYDDKFAFYYNKDFQLKLTKVETGKRIRYVDGWDEPLEKKPENPKTALRFIEHLFERFVAEAFSFVEPKKLYRDISYYVKPVTVSHDFAGGKKTAEYVMPICDRTVNVFVDMKKKRFVISGQEWHGYIMPTKNGKRPAVWTKWQK